MSESVVGENTTPRGIALRHFGGRLLEALGGNAGLLTDLIPDLVHVIGPQPAVAPASGVVG